MENNWNDSWRRDLAQAQTDVYDRLCECRNTKSDLLVIAKFMYFVNKENHTKKECLDRAIQWLTDWNNQVELIPNNYNWYLQRM